MSDVPMIGEVSLEQYEDHMFFVLYHFFQLIFKEELLDYRCLLDDKNPTCFSCGLSQLLSLPSNFSITKNDYDLLKSALLECFTHRTYKIPPVPCNPPFNDPSIPSETALINSHLIYIIETVLSNIHSENTYKAQARNPDFSNPRPCQEDPCSSHSVIGFDLSEVITCTQCIRKVDSKNFFQYFEIGSLLQNIERNILERIHNTPIDLLTKENRDTNSMKHSEKLIEEIKKQYFQITSKCFIHHDVFEARKHCFNLKNPARFYGLVFYWDSQELSYVNAYISLVSIPGMINLADIYTTECRDNYFLVGLLFKNTERYDFAVQKENRWTSSNYGGISWEKLVRNVIRDKSFVQCAIYERNIRDPDGGVCKPFRYAFYEKLAYEYDIYEKLNNISSS